MTEPQGRRVIPWTLLVRLRWPAIWGLIALWVVGLAFDLGGNLVHLLLLGAIALLVHELLTEEGVRKIVEG